MRIRDRVFSDLSQGDVKKIATAAHQLFYSAMLEEA